MTALIEKMQNEVKRKLQTEATKFMDILTILQKLENQGFLNKILNLLQEIRNDEHNFTIQELIKLQQEFQRDKSFCLEEQYINNVSIFKKNLNLVFSILIDEIWDCSNVKMSSEPHKQPKNEEIVSGEHYHSSEKAANTRGRAITENNMVENFTYSKENTLAPDPIINARGQADGTINSTKSKGRRLELTSSSLNNCKMKQYLPQGKMQSPPASTQSSIRKTSPEYRSFTSGGEDSVERIHNISKKNTSTNASHFDGFNTLYSHQSDDLAYSEFHHISGAPVTFSKERRKVLDPLKEDNFIPGPGAYCKEKAINQLSTLQKSPQAVFGKSPRRSQFDRQEGSPGPTAYYPKTHYMTKK